MAKAEKHYGVGNANKLITVNGVAIRFVPYNHSAGAWTGFYSTSNPAEQASLDALLKKKEVFKMTAEEVEQIKKKAPSLKRLTESQGQPAQLDDAEAAVKEEAKELPEVDDILNVEKVAKPAVRKRKGRK